MAEMVEEVPTGLMQQPISPLVVVVEMAVMEEVPDMHITKMLHKVNYFFRLRLNR